MEFIIAKNQIDDYKNECSITFYYEDDAFPGVRKIADKVRKDVERVVSAYPRKINKKEELGEYAVIYGTVGHSPILEYLNENKIIDLSQINDKREVYIFKITEIPMLGIKSALIIAGSDKRGTIYGLFHLSECMGVSPLVDWSEVNPKKVKEVILTPKDSIISRIPSVKYRGIFINDEWPAFGTWAIQKFGGFNAKMYEHVFELIPIGIDRRLLKSRETAEVIIKAQGSKVTIVVEAENYDISNLHQMTFLETQGYIAMEAEHYYKKYDLADVDFVKLDNYGRTKSAMKLMPNINNLSTKSDKPWLEYCFAAKNEGEYFVELYLAPSNTTYIDGKMNFGMQINGEEIKIKNAVCDNFTSLDFRCSEWVKAIIDNIRIYKDKIYCKKGINYLRIYGISSSFVLERIVLYSINGNVPKSYLGPVESFYCK